MEKIPKIVVLSTGATVYSVQKNVHPFPNFQSLEGFAIKQSLLGLN